MITYILDNDPRYTFIAKNKDDLRAKALGKVKDGWHSIYSKNGTYMGSVHIDRKSVDRAASKRPRLSKADYDQLYYYVTGKVIENLEKGESPLRYSSPRRYDTLEEVRKAALAKSHKTYLDNKARKDWGFPPENIAMCIFKGTRYLGFVSYDPTRTYDGIWSPASNPKDPSPMRKDGTIGAKRR